MFVAFGVLFALAMLGLLIWHGRQFFSGSRALPCPPAGAVLATLTVTGVSPERGPDGPEAFCTISGFLNSSELAPTEVYDRIVVLAGGHWPRPGEQLTAFYLPGKAATHWWLEPRAGWNAY
ncbi:hypothetical protein [Segniliparus rugosus]|uniref:Uncharacterized protein n=1 Tax=Segniliparus rugosus (strain ATCC BAA-974 / DSM 45345 / CCUG 50838 / CIP 108380 / JCM 13579 / CDC 945) TaxID=679197 RepID=E5XP00_SEGRC|nr:hypothetical protein [Segniliparus rugosus]EFV13892.2 hypothetical protein HMPREF9336_01221 [Segniliparus rugosus ATCC BAA-974]